MTNEEIKNYCFNLASKGICQGGCDEHTGDVKVVYVPCWGYFPYCETAIAEDVSRGFFVEVINE